MFAVTAAQFTTGGTADILIDRNTTLWGYPETLISDNGQQVASKLSNAVYDRFGISKINTSAYHPSTSGGVECVNHELAQMLSKVRNDRKPTGIYICHTSCRPATTSSCRCRTSPNEIHFARLTRIPLSVYQPPSFGGHQSLGRDFLAYINLATDWQQRAYRRVRQLHAIYVRRTTTTPEHHHHSRPFTVGGWAWIYNSASTVHQGARKDPDAPVLKTNTPTSPPIGNNVPTASSDDYAPSTSLDYNTGMSPSWPPFSSHSLSPQAAGPGSTASLPPSVKAPARSPTPWCSRPISP